MKKTGLVYRRESGPFNYQAWPTVTADENGVLYAVWSGNRVNHIDVFAKTYLSKSYDNGETWSLPQIINDSYLDDRDAGICYLGNNKFIISYFSHDINMYLNDWREHSTNPMTPAEKAIYEAYIARVTTKEIMANMNIKESTLKYHNRNIYGKLGVSNRNELLELHKYIKSVKSNL